MVGGARVPTWEGPNDIGNKDAAPDACWQHDVDFAFELKEGLRLDLGRGRGNKRRGTGVVGLDNWQLYFDLRAAYDRRGKCEYVVSYRGKKLGKVDLSDAYKRAGLTRYKRRNHLLKHTCCSWLVQSGASFEAVAKLVGTRAETIRKHYGHLSREHLETVAGVLSV
jgi:integrase